MQPPVPYASEEPAALWSKTGDAPGGRITEIDRGGAAFKHAMGLASFGANHAHPQAPPRAAHHANCCPPRLILLPALHPDADPRPALLPTQARSVPVLFSSVGAALAELRRLQGHRA